MKSPKVSIVVAIYKSELFLDKLIQSLISQTYSNIEIILVNDGSPDNSGIICDEYSVKDDRIAVVHKKNGGTCETRNVGMDFATGDYLMFVDGDDWLADDCVEYLLNLALSTDSEMSLTDRIFTTRDQIQSTNTNIEIWSPEQAVVSIIYPRFPIGPWNKLYKMSMLKNNHIRFDVPWSGEGLYFSSMAAACSNQVCVGHRKVYNYRQNNPESGLTRYNVIIAQNALWNIKNIRKVIKLKTPRIIHAIDWHIWKNYNFLLRLIIATGSVRSHLFDFLECMLMIRLYLPKAVIGTEFSKAEKISFIKRSIRPIHYAKELTRYQQEELKKDMLK